MMIQLALLLALTQDAEKAQTLHAEMCAALLEARTLQFDYKCEGRSKGIVAKSAQGRILMEAPGSFYQKFEVTTAEKTESLVTISDGVQIRYGDAPPKPAVATMLKNFKGIVGIMGLSTHFFNKAVRGLRPEMKNFSLGKKESVNGMEAQVVSYAIDFGKPELTVTTTVWIDLQSKLPLKRATFLKAGSDDAELTDAFTGMKSGEKIDPKWFVIPK